MSVGGESPLVVASPSSRPEWRTVVRVSTSTWKTKRGLRTTRDIVCIKKHSFGWNALLDEIDCIGAEETAAEIANLHTCKDGLYELQLVDVVRALESGLIASFSLKLLPWEPDDE